MSKFYFKINITLVCIQLLFSLRIAAQWSELGGLNTFANTWSSGQISNISVGPTTNNIFAGGDFGSVTTREVSRFINNTNSWSKAGNFNANCNIYDFEIIPSIGTLAGGCFMNTNGETFVSRFDGTNWVQFGNALGQGAINEICTNSARTAAYVGGPTNSNGKVYIASWNGNSWVELGGVNSLSSILGASTQQIFTICADQNGNIYAAGNIYGSSGAGRIAKFDGTSWSLLPITFNGSIEDMKTDLFGNIYVAGAFKNSSGNYCVAKFNGTNWSELGGLNSLSANCTITSLAIDKFKNIYAAGCFTNGNGKRYVAKFDGNSWSELGGNNSLSANGNILTLAVDTLNNILAAGDFTNLNGNKYVARYTCQITTPTITANNPTMFCEGVTVTLNSNSSSNYTYQWYQNGNAIPSATVSNYQATQTATYTVKVIDGACSATSSGIPVIVKPLPNNGILVSGSTTFCSGNSVSLIAQGIGTYLWNNGATTQTINVSQSGSYSVTITSNSCSATSSVVNVLVNPTPTANISTSGNTTFCQGGSITLTATGGTTYKWNTGIASASINVSQSGIYTASVVTNGCQSITSKTITVNALPSLSLTPIANYINLNNSAVNLSANPAGGVFSGSGVSGSVFNPKNAGLGIKTMSYSYTNTAGCFNKTSQNTLVYDTTGTVCTKRDTVTTYITVTDTLVINTFITGISGANQTTTIKIFPNPTNDHITILYGNFTQMNGYTLKITNALGQLMFSSPINQASSYLDLAGWSGKGIYFVHILNPQNNAVEVRKIVLQ